jgi:hypothetical protein
MRPEDVDECVDVVRNHPVIGRRYGPDIARLPGIWRNLLPLDAVRTGIIEAVEGARATICFVGFTVCVADAFIDDIKRAPLGWIGPQLISRIEGCPSPVLSDTELREANSTTGLRSIVWEGCIRGDFDSSTELYREIVTVFMEEHRGFRWNEFISSQMESAERLTWTLSTGGCWWDPAEGRYMDRLTIPPDEAWRKPHVIGITREVERQRPASWVGGLFEYHPPRCGFSRAEQVLLETALDGATDEELARTLSLSVTTVKKTWLSIYSRLGIELPALLPEDKLPGAGSQRGREKKRRLLMYLRQHPEELRPVSRHTSQRNPRRPA